MATGFLGGAAASNAGLLPFDPSGQPPWVTHPFRLFWEAWSVVQQHYIDQAALDPTGLTHGAVQGMLDALGDPGHTRFLTADALKQENQALSGQLEGIGAEVDVQDGRLVIVAPIAGSPAERAGLRSGDVILQVDGQSLAGFTLASATQLIRGPAGSTVSLTVLRQDANQLEEVSVTRARLPVTGVIWAMLPGTRVAHIFISQFKVDVNRDLGQALLAARAQGAAGVILDLRNNPGGVKEEGLGVASQFIERGLVLQERDAKGQISQSHARPGGLGYNLPLVVLINQGSASASEIVAGALQDHGRAKVIGVRSFGTGTVLSTYPLSDGSAIRLGTSEFLTPNGREIWHHGITPDVEVRLPLGMGPLTPLQAARLTPQQLRASPDAQLLRALEELER